MYMYYTSLSLSSFSLATYTLDKRRFPKPRFHILQATADDRQNSKPYSEPQKVGT